MRTGWGIWTKRGAYAGIDMGVDHLGKGLIVMPADGEIVRVLHSGSGWPGIGGLIVVQCDSGPMSAHPLYSAEDIHIPVGHRAGKRLKMGELLAIATGTNQAPGIESGWAGSKKTGYHGTLFQELHGTYTEHPRDTAEGHDFWNTLQAWMKTHPNPQAHHKLQPRWRLVETHGGHTWVVTQSNAVKLPGWIAKLARTLKGATVKRGRR